MSSHEQSCEQLAMATLKEYYGINLSGAVWLYRSHQNLSVSPTSLRGLDLSLDCMISRMLKTMVGVGFASTATPISGTMVFGDR